MIEGRAPLSKWSYPQTDALQGETFPSGNPKFCPFPTVTNLLLAKFCPVALLHDLLHGRDYALLGTPDPEIKRRGDLFHKFIAHIKESLIKGELKLSGYDISQLFHPFAEKYGFKFNARNDLYRRYIGPWVERKFEELKNISQSDRDKFFFEISVANYYVPFPYKDGKKSYPLEGRIDEIDIKNKRIIERTIKGFKEDTEPPALKDYQTWLLWKTLSSLKRNQLPSQWRDINFEEFELIVETPYKDFSVSYENPSYVEEIHSGYAWIHDISISESRIIGQKAYENRSTDCPILNPEKECGLIHICRHRNYPYPQSRPEIKQIFKPWYQYLLWEQIWEGSLFQYQLLKLPKEELIEKGLILEGKIISFNGDRKIELEINKKISSLGGYDEYTIIPFGTLFCGKHMRAKLSKVKGNRLIIELISEGVFPSETAILFPDILESSSPLLQEPPTFLERQTQSGLLKLQQSGAIKEEKAKERSWVQLLEAIFGIKLLRRGSK